MSDEIALVAEVGSVHDGSFGNAIRLIDLAAECGADVVKFQTHIPDAETVKDAPSPSYFTAESRFDYFLRTGFSATQWRRLREHADFVGIGFLSSPFSLEAVDLLEEIGADGYKIASGEVTNVPLLERVAATGKRVLLSSGMSSWSELDLAVDVLRGSPLTVLQCSSAYPCPPERVGLNVISEMRERYGLPVGFSDHTQGIAAAIAAAALGATTIEKHLTFSRAMYGSDAPLASEPGELRLLADALAAVAIMRSTPVDKDDVAPYAEMKRIFEKSVVTAGAVTAGAVVEPRHLAFKKPGDGVPARDWRSLIGRTWARDLAADHLVTWEDLR